MCTFIQIPPLRSPSTQLTKRKHNTSSLPLHPGDSETCPSMNGDHWLSLFNETTLPVPGVDSKDDECLLTADLGDQVWSEEPVPDGWEYLCIHKIPRPATPPLQPNQVEVPEIPLQPNQVEMPLGPEYMEVDIPEDIPDLIDIPEEVYQTLMLGHTVC